MKTSKDYLEEANRVVRKIDFSEALMKHTKKNAVFIDVRDSSEIAKTGSIPDALKIQRGLIEFVADESTKLYNSKLKKDTEIILVCGAGGQAARQHGARQTGHSRQRRQRQQHVHQEERGVPDCQVHGDAPY